MLYSQIKQYLDYGLMVEVVDRFKNKRLFVYVDENDLLLTSTGYLWNEGDINLYEQESNGWHIHSLLPRPITPYPVGMKVRVDESYRKANIKSKWVTDEEPVTIEKVVLNDNGTYEYKLSDNSEIDHRFLIPVLEEEKEWNGFKLISTKEDWIKEGRTRGWIKGGEVIE